MLVQSRTFRLTSFLLLIGWSMENREGATVSIWQKVHITGEGFLQKRVPFFSRAWSLVRFVAFP